MKPVDGQSDEQRVVGAEQDQVGSSEDRLHAGLVGGVIVLGAILGAMPPVTERFGTVAFLALYGVALAIWVTIALASRLRSSILPFPIVALVAVLLRLTVFAQAPELSQDVQRYRWDGLVATSGLSPYTYSPDAPALASLRSSWHALINHPEIRTIYPPAAQSLFTLWALTGGSLVAWRLLLLAFDLATLRLLGPRSALLWATCPLVVVEGFWSAHLEIVPAALLLAATCAVARRRELSGAIAAGLAIGMKVVPVAAVPALSSFTSRRARFLALLALTLLLPVLPFLAGGPLMPGFGDYARRWEFNAPLYESLHWLVGASGVDVALKALWSSVKEPLGAETISPFVYGQLHPARIARALCGVAFLAGLLAAMRFRSIEARVAWSVAALLLCSPVLHPWYWITLLPLALEARSRLLVALAAASPASYLLYTGLPAATPLAATATYLLPLVATLALRRTMAPSRPTAAEERPEPA